MEYYSVMKNETLSFAGKRMERDNTVKPHTERQVLHALSLSHMQTFFKLTWSRVPVAHVCNPSSSGGRDQEDQGSKQAQASSSQDPILKNPTQKRAAEVTSVLTAPG
jgi:hypothetical protein